MSGERSRQVPSTTDDEAKTTTFTIHGYEGVNEARKFGLLRRAIERRGLPCTIVPSPRTRTTTPNRDRAKIVVEAMCDI
jgi:hypothetical protein